MSITGDMDIDYIHVNIKRAELYIIIHDEYDYAFTHFNGISLGLNLS